MNQTHASTGTSVMLMLGSVGLVFLAVFFGFGRGLELKRVFTHPLLVLLQPVFPTSNQNSTIITHNSSPSRTTLHLPLPDHHNYKKP